MRKRKERKSSIDTFQEWQEHQYVEGYYVGGRIPPFYLGKRPNRFGFVLLTSGIVFVLVATLGAFSWARLRGFDLWSLSAIVVAGGIGVLQLAVSVRLLRKSSGKRGRRKYPKA